MRKAGGPAPLAQRGLDFIGGARAGCSLCSPHRHTSPEHTLGTSLLRRWGAETGRAQSRIMKATGKTQLPSNPTSGARRRGHARHCHRRSAPPGAPAEPSAHRAAPLPAQQPPSACLQPRGLGRGGHSPPPPGAAGRAHGGTRELWAAPDAGSCGDGAPAAAPGRTPASAPLGFHRLFPKLHRHLTNGLSFVMKKPFTGCMVTCSLFFTQANCWRFPKLLMHTTTWLKPPGF